MTDFYPKMSMKTKNKVFSLLTYNYNNPLFYLHIAKHHCTW